LRDAPPGGIMCISNALVAQPDRASDYESEGRRFESCRARPQRPCKCGTFSFVVSSERRINFPFDRELTVARCPRLHGPLRAMHQEFLLRWSCTSIRCRINITKSAPKLRAVACFTCEIAPRVDWIDAYLDLAKDLANPQAGLSPHEVEARQRSAVSRAYYAIFLTARDKFYPELKYLQSGEGSSHVKLWKRFKTNSDQDMRDVGRRANDLKEYRRQADYGEHITNPSFFVADAMQNAEDLKGDIDTLPERLA
jgi:uncharacterized protein (UPF0332 family)